MKSLVVVFGVLLMIVALPLLFQAARNAEIDEYTQTFNSVTTGAGETSVNVTLTQDPLDDAVADIISISSNTTVDDPSAAAFYTTDNDLEVSGLAASTTRTLQVTYAIASASLPTGMAVFFDVMKWFYVFCIIGLLGAAIYAFFD